MNKTVLVLSLTVALLVGYIVGGVATQLVIPPVRAGTNPAKWEYKCFDTGNTDSAEASANRLGAAGFELAAAGTYSQTSAIWCFKRRLP